jgi:hypothetical protein
LPAAVTALILSLTLTVKEVVVAGNNRYRRDLEFLEDDLAPDRTGTQGDMEISPLAIAQVKLSVNCCLNSPTIAMNILC